MMWAVSMARGSTEAYRTAASAQLTGALEPLAEPLHLLATPIR